MKKVLLSEIKAGDVFRMGKDAAAWVRSYIWYGATETAVLEAYRGGTSLYLRRLGDTNMLCDLGYAKNYAHVGFNKLEVDLLDPKTDLKPQDYLANLYSRVGNQTGCDPEIFVMSGGVRPRLIPAWKFLTDKPSKDAIGLKGTDSGNTTSWAYKDGFAAEFYTAPVTCHGYGIDYIRGGLRRVLAAARKFDPEAQLTIRNTFKISAKTMASGTDEEVRLGCKPSMNVYGDNPELPNDARAFPMRFTGGHVHLDLIKRDRSDLVIKGCDLWAGIAGVAMFQNIDQPLRRQFYGRAGEYRPTKYGVEYRVLSNAWLVDPRIAHLMLNIVRCGAKIGYNSYVSLFGMRDEEITSIINNCDVKAAKKFVSDNIATYLKLLQNDGNNTDTDAGRKLLLAAVNEGVEAVIPGVDVAKNWKLEGEWANHSNGDAATWAGLVAGRKM